MLIDLAEKYTELKKVSASEWAGPCLACGGTDRFRVWPDKDRYWCRSCDAKGDPIQFCRDFLGMDYPDALRATGNHAKLIGDLPQRKRIEPARIEKPAGPDLDRWQRQADQVSLWCHKQLMKRPDLLAWLEQKRGISRFTVEAWQLGFNPRDNRSGPGKWGYPANDKPLWLPAGITISHRQPDGRITGINIRRFKLTDQAPPDVMPTEAPECPYHRVKGTISRPWVLARGEAVTGPVVVVESELDALLLWQELDLIVTPVALLTAGAKPKPGELPPGPVMFALDFDEAGKKAWPWWQKQGARSCPPAEGKDISDMMMSGINLLDWLHFNMAEEGLIRPEVLNPYAHFCLVAGPDWADQGSIPDHIWQSCRDLVGPVVRWQLACDNPEARRLIEAEYRSLWGVS